MARELTREEKAKIRKLVKKWCANYDKECGCLPLDCECYMLGKCWTGAYCRYFREAVLPLDPVLAASICEDGPAPDTRLCSLPGLRQRLSPGRQDALLLPGLCQESPPSPAAGSHEEKAGLVC